MKKHLVLIPLLLVGLSACTANKTHSIQPSDEITVNVVHGRGFVRFDERSYRLPVTFTARSLEGKRLVFSKRGHDNLVVKSPRTLVFINAETGKQLPIIPPTDNAPAGLNVSLKKSIR